MTTTKFITDVFLQHTPHDVCHKKTDLKVFVVVISKEGWARVAVPSFFWYDTDFLEFVSFDFIYHILGVIPKEEWVRPHVPILLLV